MKLKKFFEKLDPYYYLDLFLYKYFKNPDTLKKKIIFWVFYLLYSFILAFIIYQIFSLIFATSMPFATVVSGSMEPSFYRGDIVLIKQSKNLDAKVLDINTEISNKDISEFLEIEYQRNKYNLREVSKVKYNNQEIDIDNIYDNDVIVYHSNLRNIPVIHRLVGILNAQDGNFAITKGDNHKTNRSIDQDCEIINQKVVENSCLHLYPLPIDEIEGKKIGRIPYIGYLKLFLFG